MIWPKLAGVLHVYDDVVTRVCWQVSPQIVTTAESSNPVPAMTTIWRPVLPPEKQYIKKSIKDKISR